MQRLTAQCDHIMFGSNSAMEHLLGILTGHDLQLDDVDVKQAFDDADFWGTVTEWVREHLEPGTLLSNEKAALFDVYSPLRDMKLTRN